MSQFLAILSVQSKIGFDEYHSHWICLPLLKAHWYITLVQKFDQNPAADKSSLR